MHFDNKKVLVVLAGFIVASSVQAQARERVREKEKEKDLSITEQLRRRQGTTGEIKEKLEADKEKAKELEQRLRNAGTDGASTGPGPGGIGTRPGATGSLKEKAHEGETESVTFGSGGRVQGARSAEIVGSGGRQEATGRELKGAERTEVAELARKERDAMASTVEGAKDQKAAIAKLKELEASTRLFNKDSSGKLVANFSKDRELNDTIRRLTQFAEKETGGDFELALRVMAEKMLKQGKSFAEVEATIKDFVAFWQKEVEGKLPKELQKDALTYMLTLFHRNPKALAGMKAKITELMKSESDPAVVLKGMVLSAKAYGEPFLKGIKEGLSIKEAHDLAVKAKIEFLHERNLSAKEIAELPQCTNPALGLAEALLSSGH